MLLEKTLFDNFTEQLQSFSRQIEALRNESRGKVNLKLVSLPPLDNQKVIVGSMASA